MFEENPDKTNMTEDAREEEGAPSDDAPVEAGEPTAEPESTAEADEAVPEGVAESAAGTEEASDAGEEPSAVPEEASEGVEEPPASPEDAAGQPEPAEEPREPAEESAVIAAEEAPEPPARAEPSGDGEATAAPAVEEEVAGDPYSGPGDWYVIHTYAGYENKVKTNLGSRIQTMQMQDKIFDVVIPMEDVMEIKGGRKQVVQKKVFPGYLLVKMIYDDESWFVVRNTPGVTGFVSSGTGQKPTPLSRREVERILGRKKEEAKPAFRLDFEVDDVVRIISGPFADFNGTIAEINLDQSKVKVMVNIFDRETPVELGFDQVARV